MIKLLLLAFVAFALSQLVLRIVRSMRIGINDAMAAKAVHVETPVGMFDLKPHATLDPQLASMLIFPGATPAASQPAEYEAEAKIFGRDFRVLAATYWTLTPADVVWEFYRRELPAWHEKRRRGYGRSLIQETPEGTRAVRVYGQNDSTLIEIKVSLNHKAEAASVGSGRSSATRFGMLR